VFVCVAIWWMALWRVDVAILWLAEIPSKNRLPRIPHPTHAVHSTHMALLGHWPQCPLRIRRTERCGCRRQITAASRLAFQCTWCATSCSSGHTEYMHVVNVVSDMHSRHGNCALSCDPRSMHRVFLAMALHAVSHALTVIVVHTFRDRKAATTDCN